MRIEIEIKALDQMRYPTVGDFFFKEDGTLKFEIADTGDIFLNKMVLIHEMIEQALTEKKGIKNTQIDEFDFEFEKNRKDGDTDEPGFAIGCPYMAEHSFATGVEMGMCALSGVSWDEYEKILNEL